MDLGVMVEGILEQDPLSDRYFIRIEAADGSVQRMELNEALKPYAGQEVRFILTPFSTINQLAEMVESGEISLDEAVVKPSF